MNILALDLSSKSTGWAIAKENKMECYGCITASSTDYITRLEKISKEICDLIKTHKIEKVVCEEVRFGDTNVHTFKILMYLQAKIVMDAHTIDKNIQFDFQQPSEWRKKVGIKTGRGVTRDVLKRADIEYAAAAYNVQVNDDIADALGILDSVIKKPVPVLKATIVAKQESAF